MRVAVLYSGGKDSTFALSWAQMQGWDVCGLVTLHSSNPHSFMFHTPNIHLVKLQAECLDLPLVFHETAGEKEKELDDLRDALALAKRMWKIDGLVTGAVASNYQEERINRICHELGLKTYAPLWHKGQEQLVREMVAGGFEIVLQAVAGDGLTEEFLGRVMDDAFVDRLVLLNKKCGIHVGGEGGEYESLGLDCPLFKKRLVIEDAHIEMENECTGVWVIEGASVNPKEVPSR